MVLRRPADYPLHTGFRARRSVSWSPRALPFPGAGERGHMPLTLKDPLERPDKSTELRHAEALLQTGALQSAIFNSANFSSIATDAKGVIQIFNVGAERMLGYTAAEVVNQ